MALQLEYVYFFSIVESVKEEDGTITHVMVFVRFQLELAYVYWLLDL